MLSRSASLHTTVGVTSSAPAVNAIALVMVCQQCQQHWYWSWTTTWGLVIELQISAYSIQQLGTSYAQYMYLQLQSIAHDTYVQFRTRASLCTR